MKLLRPSTRSLLLLCGVTMLWGASLPACGGSPLSKQHKKHAAVALKKMKELDRRDQRVEKRLAALVKSDRAFLKGHRQVVAARKRIGKLREKIKALKKLEKEVRTLLKKNRASDEKKLRKLSGSITYRAGGLKLNLLLAIGPVEEIVNAKKNAKQLIRQVAGHQAQAKTFPSAAATQAVASAAKQYPESKAKLEARLKALGPKAVDVSAAGFHRARNKQPPNYLGMGRWAKHIRKQVDGLGSGQRRLLHQIGELAEHVDLILVDMKDEHGKYYHRYKRVRGSKVETQAWKVVTSGFYIMHRDHLGMTLWSKPVGVLADDAQTLAAPPGYIYVGKPRYGGWLAGKGDNKKWKFNDKYSYMQTLFWGGGLGIITFGAYAAYLKLRRARKVFYGVGAPIYGSRSKRMRGRYKKYYARKARKTRAAAVRARARRSGSSRTGSSRTGGSSRSSRRSGK